MQKTAAWRMRWQKGACSLDNGLELACIICFIGPMAAMLDIVLILQPHLWHIVTASTLPLQKQEMLMYK